MDMSERPQNMIEETKRIVSQHGITFTKPPEHVPDGIVPDGPLLGNGDLGIAIGGRPQRQTFYLGKNDFWYALADSHYVKPQAGPRFVGGLDIDTPALDGATYHAEQSIYEATVASRFTVGKTALTMHSWTAATENLLIIRLEAEGKPLDVRVRLWAMTTPECTNQQGTNDDGMWVSRKFAGEHLQWTSEAAAAVRVLGDAPVAFSADDGYVMQTLIEHKPVDFTPESGAAEFTLTPGSPVTLAVSILTNFDTPEPVEAAPSRVAALDTDAVAALREAHETWWHAFWAESFVEIGDPDIEAHYYASHYYLACSSRNEEFAPGLAGNWITTEEPAWGGFYTINYNQQTTYWACYSSNHISLTDAYDGIFLDYMDVGRVNAKKYHHCRGISYEVAIGPCGLNIGHGVYWNMQSQAVHGAVNMIMRFRSTRDCDYARKVYEYLIEVANFYEDYLWFEDGRYFIFNDSCHEAGPWAGPTLSEMERDTNPIITLAMLRLFLTGLLDISEELGTDAGRREKWQHMLNHLSPYPTMKRDGRTIFRLTEVGQDWVGNAAMALWPVFPCGQVGRDSDPELFKIARDTHDAKDRWLDDNHFPIYFPAAARVGVDPNKIIEELHALIGRGYGDPAGSLDNRFIASRGGQLENVSGIPSAINEMLMQSYEDVVRIFPDWPNDRDARFGQLRADGAFLVSSEQKDGQIQYVTVHSEKGRPCVVENPWPDCSVAVQSDGEADQTVSGERFTLTTSPGQTLTLTCATK